MFVVKKYVIIIAWGVKSIIYTLSLAIIISEHEIYFPNSDIFVSLFFRAF